jgi:hypothetical protein
LVSNVTSVSAQASWQAGGTPAPGTSYTVIYGQLGFNPSFGAQVTTSTTTAIISGLFVNTDYCYYVRQQCGGGAGTSPLAGPFCFRTAASGTAPFNDNPCGAVSLTLTPSGSPLQPVASTTLGSTTTTLSGITLPVCSPATAPRDVWFTMLPAFGAVSVTFTLTGAPAGMVRVYTTPNCANGFFTLVACRSSGASNVGLTSMTFPVTQGVRYYVAVSGYNNLDNQGAFTIAGSNTLSAARPQAETGALVVFPNPSNTGQLTLRLASAHAAGQATLFNALGQEVLRKAMPAGILEQTLRTSGLATGLYTLRVTVGDEVLTRKVVLEQ